MSENKDEKYRKLRDEVNLLKEQLIKIADELEEEPEPEPQDEPIPIEIEDTPDQEKEEPSENDWETEDDEDWENQENCFSTRRPSQQQYSCGNGGKNKNKRWSLYQEGDWKVECKSCIREFTQEIRWIIKAV